MTPFQVYLLMQADTIRDASVFAAVFLGAALIIASTFRMLFAADVTTADINNRTVDWRLWQTAIKAQRWCAALFIPALLLSTFMPSTKTIAAMVVLPKITSPAALDALGAAGKELYGITREALQGLADRAKPHDQQGKNK